MWKDDTKSVSLEKYRNAQNRFYECFSSTPGVINYGTFGSIKAPGLSDLDLVVVVEDECLARKEFSVPELQGDEKYIFTHSPLIIPASLLDNLHYYHLIDINWANGSNSFSQVENIKLSQIGMLHVLFKTLYLQSFLWNLLLKTNRPCRRSIIALTSVARSIQLLTQYSIPVKKQLIDYTESIINLRNEWISYPNNREYQFKILDRLLPEALAITIELPESLSAYLLEVREWMPSTGPGKRGIHNAPLKFIFDINEMSVANIISAVRNEHLFFDLINFFGKFKPFIVGNFAFAGPSAFSILDLDFSLSEDYRTSIGGYRWGDPISHVLYKEAKRRFSDALLNMFNVNYKFAKALDKAGLADANFGNVWMSTNFKGQIIQRLAWTMGKVRVLRHVQTTATRTAHKGRINTL